MVRERRKRVRDYLLQGIQEKTFKDSSEEEYTVRGIKTKKGRIYLEIIYLEIETETVKRNAYKPLVESLNDLEVSASKYRSLSNIRSQRAQKITSHVKKSATQTILELRAEEDENLNQQCFTK